MSARAASFRRILQSRDAIRFLEAHDGLSARIAEKYGFQGIWASGLSLSTVLGVRDSNEASWTQLVDAAQVIQDSTNIPVLFDGDSGHGDFNNARRLSRKLSAAGFAGFAIEDKRFPKLNSFVDGPQALEDPDDFAGKIKASQDSKVDPNFCVIARTEALVAGASVGEALDRALKYAEAGADAIFIHSKAKSDVQIREFAARWDSAKPLVIAPTTYNDTPYTDFAQMGVSVCLCANHMMRAAAKAMCEVASKLKQSDALSEVDADIASLREIFDLYDYDELAEARRAYLHRGHEGAA